MSEEKFPVRIVRSCLVNGQLSMAGQTVSVTAETAADLIRSTRGVLVHSEDIGRIATLGREAEVHHAGQQRTVGHLGPR